MGRVYSADPVQWLARFAVLVTIATSAAAGVRFDFSVELSGDAYSYRGKIAIQGTSSRVDIVEGSHPLFNPNYTILTRAGGNEIVVLDHRRRTYWKRRTGDMAGHLATTRGIGKSTARRPRLETAREGATQLLTARYELMMDVEGERFPGTVEMEARVETDARIEQRALPWGLVFAVKTGYEDIDRAIARRLTRNLPLHQVVTVSRRIADGPVVTETLTATVANLVEEDIAGDEFTAPAGYRYEEPAFVFGR
jgi:hypothetical protein